MLCDQHVLVQTDNTKVVYYLSRGGGTRSRSLNQLARDLTPSCIGQHISLMAVHLTGVDNVEGDFLS